MSNGSTKLEQRGIQYREKGSSPNPTGLNIAWDRSNGSHDVVPIDHGYITKVGNRKKVKKW